MSTSPLAPWGPFYGNAPLLQDAINHAERLSGVLKTAAPRGDDEHAAAWLAGRVDEIEVFVDLTVQRWRFEGVGDRATSDAILRYLDAIHRGLALHFGELLMKCCCDGLFTTSVPASTTSVTGETTSPSPHRRDVDRDTTADGVPPSELLEGLVDSSNTPTERA